MSVQDKHLAILHLEEKIDNYLRDEAERKKTLFEARYDIEGAAGCKGPAVDGVRTHESAGGHAERRNPHRHHPRIVPGKSQRVGRRLESKSLRKISEELRKKKKSGTRWRDLGATGKHGLGDSPAMSGSQPATIADDLGMLL
ncbi:hypothetical protein B0H14DRAFT_2567632 [Mycena olivaceomarginata]|nr:hypothetical protein B0H14DRAFT_2567632 [Mycena olivaceomarginata]